jgi:hypothetical protein
MSGSASEFDFVRDLESLDFGLAFDLTDDSAELALAQYQSRLYIVKIE